MDIFKWIDKELKPKTYTSARFIYDDMDSQSYRCLPVIYQPFDGHQKAHWRDRGSLFDFLSSTDGNKLLDFGPGDGWPSLIAAPFVEQVTGVDGSVRRVEVCTENARRLGIDNARFIHVAPGDVLPFKDNCFDGVMAASSVEQTPDPKAALKEIFRVLHPGGRLRISYESLKRYRDGREREVWLSQVDEQVSRLYLYDRHIDREFVRWYGINFALTKQELINSFSDNNDLLTFDMITIPLLEKICSAVIDARVCKLTHPSGKTLISWLMDVGFRKVIPTHSGAWFAGKLFDQIPEEQRPEDIKDVDELLQPLVKIAVQMVAPPGIDPMITAIK